jgi:hypothetical protein
MTPLNAMDMVRLLAYRAPIAPALQPQKRERRGPPEKPWAIAVINYLKSNEKVVHEYQAANKARKSIIISEVAKAVANKPSRLIPECDRKTVTRILSKMTKAYPSVAFPCYAEVEFISV